MPMKRRSVVAITIAALAAPRTLLAQPARRVYRIATLDDAVESARDHLWRIFRNRLRELVLAEGNDVAYEARYARGASERLPALAAELVALKPDIIVCSATPTTIAAMRATSIIPIVVTAAADPVGTGLVATLARPGGNVTGISIIATEIVGKQLELLREMAPAAIRLAWLTDASNKASVAVFRQLEEHARAMNATIRMLDGRKRIELERSFETIKRERVQGLFVGTTAVLLEHRDQIVQFAARETLPAVYGQREYVDAGGLLSYSADRQLAYARAADYVHRILQGAKPADLPVEQISSIRMVLNLKTARALGITVPVSVRVRADEVIE
jgi:putative ABC transport system substrate-binding protein